MKAIAAALILLLVILQYEFWIAEGGFFSVMRLKQQISGQIATNEKLTARNLALAADIQDLKYGQDAIEGRARNDLGMIKKDEVFYQVVKQTKN